MYLFTHRLNNIINHYKFSYFKYPTHLTYGIYSTHLRFNGTLHWKGVNTPNDLKILCFNVLNEAKKILNNTFNRSNPTAIDLLNDVDHVSNMLCLLADPAELLRNIHPELEWRIAANKVVDEVSMFIETVNMDKTSYEILINAVNNSTNLTFEQQKVLSHMITSMRDHGVNLNQSQKSDYLSLILQERESSHVLTNPQNKYIKIPTSLIPSNYINSNNLNNPEILIDYSLGNHILKSSEDKSKRKKIYNHIIQNSQVNQSLLNLTQTRHKMAKLRQFDNYSSLALRDNILSTPLQVNKYLSNILQSINSSLIDELNLISSDFNEVNPWDLDFLISHHEGTNHEHFTFNELMDFFKKIVKSLFDIEIIDSQAGPDWPGLIKYYFIKNDIKLCTLYLDVINREEKSGIFAQFTLKCSKSLSGLNENLHIIDKYFDLTDGQDIEFQTPSTAVVCNFFPNSSELILDINQAIMLFHELGHTLHTLLSHTKYQHLSGNRGGVDFAEFSSHFFEFYPKKILKKSNNELKSIEVAKIAILALADQLVYSNEWNNYEDLNYQLRNKLLEYPILNQYYKGNLVLDIFGIPNLSRFDHLVHYGGTYYCYLYSRSLAGMIWDFSTKFDVFSSNFGKKLQSFFNKGSIDSSIKPILDICNGDLNLIKNPEDINPKYIFI